MIHKHTGGRLLIDGRDPSLLAHLPSEEERQAGFSFEVEWDTLPHRLPLWEQVVVWVLDGLTRAVDGFTRWLKCT